MIAPTRGTPRNVSLSNSSAGKRFGKPGLTASTAGRLYFAVGSEQFVCSATVVNSRSKDIVATAAHCVWDTETGTGWGHNYLFIPGDSGNGASAPYGRWAAQRLYATSDFLKTAKAGSTSVTGEGWAYDDAFMKMSKVNGKKIQSVTGGQGIAFGLPVRSIMDVGYPSAPPFDGTSERFCSADNWQIDSSRFGDRQINCAMTPGCSGGGWLTDFDPSSGAGYLIGVNSIGGSGRLYASQMGSVALATYNYAVAGK